MTDTNHPASPDPLLRSEFTSETTTRLKAEPGWYAAAGKRAFDFVVSVALLVALLPVLVVITGLIALDGAKPIFVHRRVGRNGTEFRCFKFRSMVPDADRRLREVLETDADAAREWELTQKLRNDPRVTWIGRFLRKTSLDELPQLLNVVLGDMSLVGPRPVTQKELDRYGTASRAVLSTRPGMTGLWQVSGRGDGVSYSERVQMDLLYVRSVTLISDLRIFYRTVGVVFRGTGV